MDGCVLLHLNKYLLLLPTHIALVPRQIQRIKFFYALTGKVEREREPEFDGIEYRM